MKFLQKKIRTGGHSRGFHLVTDEILREIPEIKSFKIGMLNLFVRHTSASLSLNENADPDVRRDMEYFFRKAVPDSDSGYNHTSEGSDDMTAHIKSTIIGQSLSIPIADGKLLLGTWQGIYLCEHRNRGGKREIVLTLFGETSDQ